MTMRVVIAQPYVPSYRVAFFEALQDRLGEAGVECIVAAGVPRGDQAARGDSVRPDWLVPVKHKKVSIGGRSIDVSIDPVPWKHTDAVILGLEGSSLPVYQALLAARRASVRVGLWGHVRPYVAPGNSLDLWLERLQMHVADHVFAYTTGGRNYALDAGIDPGKVTTVMNSLDTSALERSRRNLTLEDVRTFAARFDIDPARTLSFIGGLDESKRVRFLVEVLDDLWSRDKSVRFLVGGAGPQKSLLKSAFDRGQAVDTGYLDTDGKALVMSASRAVVMPGRIGLVAVDALVMHRPVITTDWSYHAPESEYLSEESSRFTSADDPLSFANKILRVLEMKPNSDEEANWAFPTLAQMVENFAEGVHVLLGASYEGRCGKHVRASHKDTLEPPIGEKESC
ncbi:glycosyltransferase [Kocuria kalidii]|uniref:glycosyltransferase n=1 Tax=Kocuria kalidii TaxID=3376283 RepID=UPI0037B22EEF